MAAAVFDNKEMMELGETDDYRKGGKEGGDSLWQVCARLGEVSQASSFSAVW